MCMSNAALAASNIFNRDLEQKQLVLAQRRYAINAMLILTLMCYE